MTTTKKLVWRLGKLPTVAELDVLIHNDIITKDEAREVLFSSETAEDRDKKSLESEIKFLRDLVEKLSNRSNSRIVEVIKEIEVPIYRRYPWYGHYEYWCDGSTSIDMDKFYCSDTFGNTALMATSNTSNFSEIKTF